MIGASRGIQSKLALSDSSCVRFAHHFLVRETEKKVGPASSGRSSSMIETLSSVMEAFRVNIDQKFIKLRISSSLIS